jgi:hypothetical protein
MFSVVHFKITDPERQTLVVKSGDVLEWRFSGSARCAIRRLRQFRSLAVKAQ